jgi:uncharacterized UPF0160 family protein
MSDNYFMEPAAKWTEELRSGAPVAEVIASMVAAVAKQVAQEIFEHDADEPDMDVTLEYFEDHKRNPRTYVEDAFWQMLDHVDGDEIVKALQTLPQFEEMVDEYDPDPDEEDDEPDYSMIGAMSIVEEAMETVREIWPAERAALMSQTQAP